MSIDVSRRHYTCLTAVDICWYKEQKKALIPSGIEKSKRDLHYNEERKRREHAELYDETTENLHPCRMALYKAEHVSYFLRQTPSLSSAEQHVAA